MRPSRTQNDNMEAAVYGSLGDVAKGEPGKSAYEIAVEHGFEGTEEEWLAYVQANADTAVSASEAAQEAQGKAEYASDEAQGHAEAAALSAGLAHSEAEAAAASAESAAASADSASESAASAAGYKNDAYTAKAAAEAAVTAAEVQANVATGRASEAAASQIRAGVSEEHCAEMWLQMKQFPDTAKAYMEQAGVYAGEAANSASLAGSYKDAAEGFKIEAGSIRDETSALCSVTGYYATQASASAQSADASAQRAGQAATLVLERIDQSVNTALASHLGYKLDVDATAADSDKLGGDPAADYAKLASPAFTGTPTAPTATDGTNTTQIATTAFVMGAIANLINQSPATLDTLQELAAALGNDPNFSTTVMNLIGEKLGLTGGTITGDLTVTGTTTCPTIVGDVTGNVSGNAGTATAFATARTINSTSFDGTANIITDKWGYSRNITIKDASGTHAGAAIGVDGSGNVDLFMPSSIKASALDLGSGSVSDTLTILGTVTGYEVNATTLNIDSGTVAGNITVSGAIVGDLTGNVSGSSGSCTGNAATATTAGSCTGNAATATKINGKTIPIVTSFNSSTGVLALTGLS